jgi:hypothetical protein
MRLRHPEHEPVAPGKRRPPHSRCCSHVAQVRDGRKVQERWVKRDEFAFSRPEMDAFKCEELLQWHTVHASAWRLQKAQHDVIGVDSALQKRCCFVVKVSQL